MTNITIDKLMPANNVSYTNGKMDIESIAKDKFINDTPEQNFNSDVLLKNIKKKRQKLRNTLVNTYNLCCDKIKEADSIGLTDLIFELPEIMFLSFSECRDIDIINYISNNLRKQKLNTYIINNKKLFITWKFLELNKEFEKQIYDYD